VFGPALPAPPPLPTSGGWTLFEVTVPTWADLTPDGIRTAAAAQRQTQDVDDAALRIAEGLDVDPPPKDPLAR
jgi:hypothetical protein